MDALVKDAALCAALVKAHALASGTALLTNDLSALAAAARFGLTNADGSAILSGPSARYNLLGGLLQVGAAVHLVVQHDRLYRIGSTGGVAPVGRRPIWGSAAWLVVRTVLYQNPLLFLLLHHRSRATTRACGPRASTSASRLLTAAAPPTHGAASTQTTTWARTRRAAAAWSPLCISLTVSWSSQQS